MGIQIPNYLKDSMSKLADSNPAGFHFGDTFQQMIEESINLQTQSLPADSITALNNIFKKMDTRHQVIEESLQVMAAPKVSIKFWDRILESNNLSLEQISSINNIKTILEDSSGTTTQKREPIESDGEDPNVDAGSPTTGGNTQDQTQSGDGQDQSGEADGGGQDQNIQDQMPQLAPEQILQLELTQTNNKFMILTLYDKINELLDTIETILDTVSSSKTEENLDFFESLKLYQNYLNIIAELIFVMDINTVYYNFTNISIEVNDLLDKYLISSKVKVLNGDKSTPQEKESVLADLRQNLASKIEANKEIQDEGNN